MGKRSIKFLREDYEILSYSPSRRYVIVQRRPQRSYHLQMKDESLGIQVSIMHIIKVESMREELNGTIIRAVSYPRHMCITNILWLKDEKKVTIEGFSSDTMQEYIKTITLTENTLLSNEF